ncbi:MAG TPA: substrate-binding domain-containing protein [Thermoleophilaceae bacterium]|nr:substrate-binding domain-containing protein [Thermoleophilaceae bacterium]
MSRRRISGVAVAGGLAAVLAIGAAGCGSSGGDNGGSSSSGGGGGGGGGAKIAFLLPENKTARYEAQDKPDFIAGVKQLCAQCSVIYNNANQDAARQQQQAEAAIANGAKVLVIDAVDVKSATSIVSSAKQAHVPVIAYGRLIPNADLNYYISIDPYRVGQQQARRLLTALGGGQGKRVVMINGSPTDSNSAPYKNGALNIFKAAGVKVVKSYDTPDWSPDKAQTEMDQAITALGKNGFDAVYVANDGMASGAIAALKAAGIDPKTKPVTGQDAELDGVQRILTGEQLMTVYQPIEQIAKTAARLAVPLAQSKTPPAIATAKVDNGAKKVPSALLDTVVVDSHNVDSVVKAGFLTTKQICTGPYAKACAKTGLT